MYYLHTRNDMVRIPPDRLDEDISKVPMELAHQAFEGRMGPDQKLVVLITNLKLTGDSRVVPVSYTHLRAHETRHDLV